MSIGERLLTEALGRCVKPSSVCSRAKSGNPGRFSVQTLRVLGTISTATAERFSRAASLSMSRDSDDARIPAVGGALNNNCLKDVGLSFDVLTLLTENGLLHPGLLMPYAVWPDP